MACQARGGKEKTQEKILVSSEEREIGSLGKVAAASFFVEPSLCEFAAAAVCGTFHCKKTLCLASGKTFEPYAPELFNAFIRKY